MNTQDSRAAIHRQDYLPYPYLIEQVELSFDLDATVTIVKTRLSAKRKSLMQENAPLVLAGQNLKLVELRLNGETVPDERYILTEESLILDNLPERFTLESVVEIDPHSNTALEGLYTSNGMYCTQCEAEGFRKITFYPDRPDVLSRFTTTIIGSLEQEPIMLANGNLVDSGSMSDGRHFATWEDPYPKPSYLFALVAGQLTCLEDKYRTAGGRDVQIKFYVEERNREKCAHAIASLKQAMQWDEDEFGLEYDLDIYMVVAVDDFNMGAMENKGLNVFNSKYVLARPQTATDADYQAIQGVIGHEYFHNWTGNRVTCRDWFQLSLKEGLTVYRDQEFSADMTSRGVKRIEDVRVLRAAQFPEDAGPMSHPVRPDSYVEINNFYTMTVYHKGAEVVRMLETLLGKTGFRKGLSLYLERHDGEAATVEDFVKAMSDANNYDLDQFMNWYSQSGTPKVEVEADYDKTRASYRLRVKQSCPSTPRQADKQPFLIPIRLGFLDAEGRELKLQLEGDVSQGQETSLIVLTEREQEFNFINVDREPIPSLLRNFSAPVKLEYPYSEQQRAVLAGHDSDPFNRWEAVQQLAVQLLVNGLAKGEKRKLLSETFVDVCQKLLKDEGADPAFRALSLTLPGEGYLAESLDIIDPGAIHAVRESAREELASALEEEWLAAYETYKQGDYQVTTSAMGGRSLRNLALAYLGKLDTRDNLNRCIDHYTNANNMTDTMAALTVLVNGSHEIKYEILEDFAKKWGADPLVMDKWFTVQATAAGDNALERVADLMSHPSFSLKNPNKVRALIGAFAHANPAVFHRQDGAGYRFVRERIEEIDPMNPQVAARLTSAFTRWKRYDEKRQTLMRSELEKIAAKPGLSEDVYEIVSKSLKG